MITTTHAQMAAHLDATMRVRYNRYVKRDGKTYFLRDWLCGALTPFREVLSHFQDGTPVTLIKACS